MDRRAARDPVRGDDGPGLRAAGFSPRVRHEVDDFPAVLALVAIGGGVALVPELGLTGAGPEVALTRLPVHRRTLAACRQGAADAPGIAAFADAVRAAARAGITRSPSSPSSGSG